LNRKKSMLKQDRLPTVVLAAMSIVSIMKNMITYIATIKIPVNWKIE
jgi:hypothetical protein